MSMSVSEFSSGMALESIVENRLGQIFAKIFQDCIAPYYARQVKLNAGDFLGAVSMEPLGFWYKAEYVRALVRLGSTLIPVDGREKPAGDVYKELLDRGSFRSAYSGPGEYWEFVPNPIRPCKITLQMKEAVKASEAYRSLGKELTFAECGHMCSLAAVLTLIDVLGDETVDKVARVAYRFIETVKTLEERIELRRFELLTGKVNLFSLLLWDFTCLETDMQLSSFDTLPPGLRHGDICYLANHPLAQDKGVDVGMYVIYLGDAKFTGFGLDPKGVTLREVAEDLFRIYERGSLEDGECVNKTDAIITLDGRRYVLFDIKQFAEGKKKDLIHSSAYFQERLLACEAAADKVFAEKVALMPSGVMTKERFMAEGDFFRGAPRIRRFNPDQVKALIAAKTEREIEVLFTTSYGI